MTTNQNTCADHDTDRGCCDSCGVWASQEVYTPRVHEHRHSIHVGNAPITMMAGARLPIRRACECGDVITTGTYLYDPDGQAVTRALAEWGDE